MKPRVETTPWARNAARRAHNAAAQLLSRQTAYSAEQLAGYLHRGADAGLTIEETLTVVERAATLGQHPDYELAVLAPRQFPDTLDLTPEEIEQAQSEIVDVVARAMVRWVARKAREAVADMEVTPS